MHPLRMLAVLVLLSTAAQAVGEVIELRAKDTLTAVEMDHGDELRFRLRDGRTCELVLESTDAAIVERVQPGGIVYRFSARFRVDGQSMTMQRYVCSQECFYEPYVVNGVRIWLDTVQDVFDLIPIRYPREGNLKCLPRKAARLALQDATLRICPQQTRPWIDDERNFLDVGACYNGDDCYLGPYLGQACHVGMDINHTRGNPLFAPIDFDTHAYFNSLKMGHNNNRWRGIRRWDNGDVWALQTHHLIELLVSKNQPLQAGTRYATTAGVRVGSHEHTHFEFKVGRPRAGQPGDQISEPAASIARPVDFDDDSAEAQADPEVLHLDPWIVFWQIFEDRKQRQGALRAVMGPLGPGKTGQAMVCSATDPPAGQGRGQPDFWWTFGDGTCARGSTVRHVFARPGVYPVTLLVDDKSQRASTTQHVTIHGTPVKTPLPALLGGDEPSFRRRPVPALYVYGRPPPPLVHTLRFVARQPCLVPKTKIIRLQNRGSGQLAPVSLQPLQYQTEGGWLDVTRTGRGNDQQLEVAVDATDLAPAKYVATVSLASPAGASSPLCFRVELDVNDNQPAREITVDDQDPTFFATPYFWVGHRFCRCPGDRCGYHGFYLTNGSRAAAGEFARFQPDLGAGHYEVSLADQTPFRPGTEFQVRVRHARGEQLIRLRPDRSRVVGTFEFLEGTGGFVEILAENSKGLVIADAVTFRQISSAEKKHEGKK